ncbi:MAG: FKBP-type peptidyl-prolyl cis-trans isomerase, partial [Chloroherpetonaceae bacterium]|nr:FKBP-type peptidyl-prolyl cis-trans isomerase [Chloroherpetonaceae bacterium]MDW8020766.1 FKBP-type peptidyl-prolyl cis-trans isomerase [Chloroherpetonaceae bacterium]
MLLVLSVACQNRKIETLQVIDEVVGTGAVAEPGKKLTVHYTGMLTNGKVFDSSRLPGRTPFEFVLGAGQVIAGWDEGLKGMRVGGKRRLEIPPHLGYGNAQVGE